MITYQYSWTRSDAVISRMADTNLPRRQTINRWNAKQGSARKNILYLQCHQKCKQVCPVICWQAVVWWHYCAHVSGIILIEVHAEDEKKKSASVPRQFGCKNNKWQFGCSARHALAYSNLLTRRQHPICRCAYTLRPWTRTACPAWPQRAFWLLTLSFKIKKNFSTPRGDHDLF